MTSVTKEQRYALRAAPEQEVFILTTRYKSKTPVRSMSHNKDIYNHDTEGKHAHNTAFDLVPLITCDQFEFNLSGRS